MIQDGIFKAIGIPLLGVLIPWAAHLFCCPQPSTPTLMFSMLYFALASLTIWQAAAALVGRLRLWTKLRAHFPRKIFALSLASMLLAAAMGAVGGWMWQRWAMPSRDPSVAMSCAALYAGLGLLLSLLYEAIFLAKERELDVKIVDQLDHERVQAEITALKAELDPHFIFNALTTVSHLAGSSPETARSFTQKLAQVYKYFLINKERELISIQDELRFIEDYFFLLKIRYDNGVRLHLHTPDAADPVMIVPCSLQLLVENAIKHNRFSEQEPLNINIEVNGSYVQVANELRRHAFGVESTRIGLVHLRQHYRLLCNREVLVAEDEKSFTVQLPLIKQQNL